MKTQDLALHIIKEDIKYHQLVHHLSQVDVFLEYYPDFASAIQTPIAPELNTEGQQTWTDSYVIAIHERSEIS